MADNEMDKTVRWNGNDTGLNDAVIGNDDRTLVPQSMPAAPRSLDFDGDGTIRHEGDQFLMQASSDESAKEKIFVLKGVDYREVECLSDNSGEAQVFLVEKDSQKYVLKVYYPNFDVDKKLLQTIRSFNFEMIVKLIDFGKTYIDGKNRNYELMEYLQGGTLKDFQLNGDFKRFRRLALQAAGALAYCHLNNVLHKDVKPTNFFFRDKQQQQLVLGDFGISSLQDNDGKTFRTTQARTPIYAAPEMYTDVIDGEVEITPAADFYSLGMTLFATWLGESPFSSNERVMMRQKNEGRLPRLEELPEEVKKLIQGLTSVNKMTRWGYSEVERWFRGENVPVDISSPFLRYKSFVVDPDRNLVAENVHELVPMLLDNEQLGKNYLYNGRIATWLDACGNTRLSALVKDIVTKRYPEDQKAGLYAATYAMDSSQPYRDVKGIASDDVHSLALSLLSNREEYALLLRNRNDKVFIWLETHTKCNVERLRSYFQQDVDHRISVIRLVYEIDPDIPFLAHHPSSSVQEIVHYFGHGNPMEDEWHALCDGRLLSWMYSHEDMVACESLKDLTQGKVYSTDLAYKVLYNVDNTAAYDLCNANTPQAVGEILAEELKTLEHDSDEELNVKLTAFVNPDEGRFYYYAEIHSWHNYLDEAKRCFNLNSEENHERLSAYDLKTALYRFCRILGANPHYRLGNGMELTDGRHVDLGLMTQLKVELRNGALAQWLSVYYHEDPTREFLEEYSYEKELEKWVLFLGEVDQQQFYYKRFTRAREETRNRISEVKRDWTRANRSERLWQLFFYVSCFVWLMLVLFVGITGRDYIVENPILSIGIPVGGMCGIIVATRSFFQGYGSTMSLLWGLLGFATSAVPIYALKFVYGAMPNLFTPTVVILTLLYALVAYLTDFRRGQNIDNKIIEATFKEEDLRSSLLDPLYYTFKTKSHRYKGSNFGLLDEVADQVHSLSGESVLHNIEWGLLFVCLIAEFCLFSPKLLNMKNPDLGKDIFATEQVEPADSPLQEE